MSSSVAISKSSRHSKITGDFAEALVLYWLSKHGFECAAVDHTGMDLIARNPKTKQLMGISVKSRSRSTGTENTVVLVKRDNIAKLEAACQSFSCIPYFAIVVDANDTIRCFICPMQYLASLSTDRKELYWGMSQKHLARYKADDVVSFEFHTSTGKWW